MYKNKTKITIVPKTQIKGQNAVILTDIERRLFSTASIDTLMPEIEAAYNVSDPSIQDRARAAFLMGAAYEAVKLSTSKQYYDEGHNIALRLKDKRLLADSLHGQAYHAYRAGELAQAYKLEEDALRYALETDHHFRVVFSRYMLGLIALFFGAQEEGLDYLNAALEVAKRHSITKLQIRIFAKLSELCLASRQLATSRNYAEQAIRLARTLNNANDIRDGQIKLAAVELEFEHYDKVIEIVEEVRTGLPESDRSRWCISHTLLAKVYAARRKWAKSESELREGIALANYPNAERVRSNIHSHFCELYLAQEQYAPALEEAQKALEDGLTSQDIFCQKEALRLVNVCYKELRNFEKAYEFLEKYNALVAESDTALLKSRLEYHALKNDYELEKVKSETQTKKSELLRIKLDYKERELTEKIRHLIKQAEAVRQFRNDLRSLIRRTPADDPSVKDIRARLASFTEEEINWQEFEKDFKEAHPEFLQTLSEKYPDLTKMEQRIAAMIRMDLKSADIAKLFSITERAVEFHRLNLRKKLKLKQSEQLPKFLGSL
jgi:DNA-binding CsgD family transcriptional regulator